MKAIVFTTLFLGLVTGPQSVEMEVATGVETVELRLDHGTVTRLEEPPWIAEVDLGEELVPHRLVAVARGEDGRELGRAQQWVNLPRSRAEAELLVERTAGGPVARLAWRSVDFDRPATVRVLLDGEPLSVDDLAAIPLPPHDPDRLHVLSAELAFPDGSTARADLAFGGRFGEEASAEISGVPVRVERNGALREVADAGPWFRVGGEPRPVVAVDHGAAALYAVLDRSANPHLLWLGEELARRLGVDPGATEPTARGGGAGVPYRVVIHPGARGRLRRTGMEKDDRLRLVHPQASPSASGFALFGVSPPVTRDVEGGSAWLLSHLRAVGRGGAQRLADAVATAGLEAAASGRPRAVLLVLGPDPRDVGDFTPDQVRTYLGSLGVPLVVAFVEHPEVSVPVVEDEGDDERERRLAAAREARREHRERARERWGAEVVDVRDLQDWLALHRDLRDSVGEQRILWIEGVHAPGGVELSGAPPWVRPLAVPPSRH